MTETTKICSKCRKEKPLTDFSKWNKSKDKLKTECKDCCKERFKDYYNRNQQKIKNQHKQKHKKLSKQIKLPEPNSNFNPKTDPIFIAYSVQPAEYSVFPEIPQLNTTLALGFNCDPEEMTITEFLEPIEKEFDDRQVQNYIIFDLVDEFAYICYKGQKYMAVKGNGKYNDDRYYIPHRLIRMYYSNESWIENAKGEMEIHNYEKAYDRMYENDPKKREKLRELTKRRELRIEKKSGLKRIKMNNPLNEWTIYYPIPDPDKIVGEVFGKPLTKPELIAEIRQFIEMGENSKELIIT